ncbi:MAG TPA: PAS domain-containing sensor histidine kinase [Candidatus Methanoperedens sp.]
MKKAQVYDTLIKNLPIGFSIIDKDGVIIDFNHAAEKITGYLKKEVIGKSHLNIFHGSSDETSCPLLAHVLLGRKESIAAETVIRRKDGEPVVISVTTAPLFDKNGSFTGGIEFFRDITEVKRLERERKNMSMQLSDFLDFSRFETKGCQPVLGPFEIESEVYKNIEAVRAEADVKGIHLSFDFPEKMAPVLDVDEMMINRVIRNLLVNAIKYTDAGGTVTVTLAEQNHDVLFEIANTGVGIDADHLPYIFDAFYRVSKSSGGSGLGLYIAKTIVEAHRGRIWAASKPGKGSTFSFTLPKRQVELTDSQQ